MTRIVSRNSWAAVRGAWHRPVNLVVKHNLLGCQVDRRGIVSLKDTRNSQYKELRETLSKAPGLRIR